MTAAYWCVLAAAGIPYIFTTLAKFPGGRFGPNANKAPREFLDAQTGWQKRAHYAQLNGFEAFPAFAAAVIIAHLAGASQDWVDLLSLGFVVSRLVYGGLYIADLGLPRSAAWSCGIACVVGLFVVAA